MPFSRMHGVVPSLLQLLGQHLHARLDCGFSPAPLGVVVLVEFVTKDEEFCDIMDPFLGFCFSNVAIPWYNLSKYIFDNFHTNANVNDSS